MRIRTSRGTQTQIPMAVIRSSFFKGISNVTSQHTGENHGIHEAKARGSVNTLKLEIPETRSMNDPVVRFEKTGSKIFYEVYDSPSPRGKILMQSLKNGLSITPKETFLTKPSSPLTSTWWRFT